MEMMPQKPINPPAVIPVQPPDRSSHWWITLAVAVVVAVVAAGGVYWYVSRATEGVQQTLVQNMTQLQDQNRQLAESLSAKEEAVQQLTAAKTALATAAPDSYKDWQTYTSGTADMPVALTLRYPKNWTVNERVTTAAQTISGKNSRCAEFSSSIDREILAICYRQTNDTTATTWTIAGLGYLKLAKVGIQLPFGDRNLTEKTLFGDRDAVKTIIYAQNIADDETGFPARIKVGDFYFSAVVTSEQGISSSQQALYDQILASLQVTKPLAQ